MNLDKINLRGPSKIVLEAYVCSVCGKRRYTGVGRKVNHTKCSKIKQRMYEELRNGEKN